MNTNANTNANIKEAHIKGTVVAVCVSHARGTKKDEVGGRARLVEGYGIEGDAHGGNWHRQVSLLSQEKVTEFNQRGGGAGNGDFGENVVVAGIDLRTLPVGTRLRVNDALLEVTQIGKECHRHCQIFDRVGDCIMPREGIFAKVLSGGSVGKGDAIEIV
ncbi:MAG: MOSC domain-containing protein [Synergistaceae bacterium]|jgi:MOSC domain-containing protein YiiM|nr:MOSC domain-containing protein [Synergistaceae bacterium]